MHCAKPSTEMRMVYSSLVKYSLELNSIRTKSKYSFDIIEDLSLLPLFEPTVTKFIFSNRTLWNNFNHFTKHYRLIRLTRNRPEYTFFRILPMCDSYCWLSWLLKLEFRFRFRFLCCCETTCYKMIKNPLVFSMMI